MFFFNDTATTEIYTLSLHDALPIYRAVVRQRVHAAAGHGGDPVQDLQRDAGGLRAGDELVRHRRERDAHAARGGARSEEHTSELQSRQYLVCRLLLENKKNRSHLPP